jgi:hypothetical protein
VSLPSERFREGLTYDEFKARMSQNRDRLEANEREAEIREDDLAAFRALPETLNVLVIAEDWCRDTVDNLPILARLADESGRLDLRIFSRDQNQDLMNLYLKEGKYQSLPVFVFFDTDFREVGRFIERPDSVTDLRQQKRADAFAAHPALEADEASRRELNERIRGETRAFANEEAVRALRAIVEQVAAGPHRSRS